MKLTQTAPVIREYSDTLDRAAVIELWRRVFGSSTGHNEASFAIDQKLRVRDGLFFVAATPVVIGTVMAGYDGHRGWIYSVAVCPEARRRRIGTTLLRHAEAALKARGCVKVNLQIIGTNADVVKFYEQIGYAVEVRISMGKRRQEPAAVPPSGLSTGRSRPKTP